MARRVTGVFIVRAGILLACIAGGAGSLWAQGTVLDPDGLSFLEEPLAVEAGDVSLVLKGSVEGAYAHRSREDSKTMRAPPPASGSAPERNCPTAGGSI